MPSLLRYNRTSSPEEPALFEASSPLQNQRYLPSSQINTNKPTLSVLSCQEPLHTNPPGESFKPSDLPIIAKRWKRLSAPGSFTRSASWNTGLRTNRNVQPNHQEKSSKGFVLSERIKQILLPKRFLDLQSFQHHQLLKPQLEPEVHPFKRLSLSLEAQVADFAPESFKLTPIETDLNTTLAVLASLPESRQSSLSRLRSINSLAELPTMDDPARGFKPSRDRKANERISTCLSLSNRPTLPNAPQEDPVWTARQPRQLNPNNQSSLYEANPSDVALLDGIVDFFESYGAGFRSHYSDPDTLDMGSPAKDRSNQ